MQDSVIPWVKVPLKHLLNLVLSDTHQHQVHFWSSFGYRFSSHMHFIRLVCYPQFLAGSSFEHSSLRRAKSKLLFDRGSIRVITLL